MPDPSEDIPDELDDDADDKEIVLLLCRFSVMSGKGEIVIGGGFANGVCFLDDDKLAVFPLFDTLVDGDSEQASTSFWVFGPSLLSVRSPKKRIYNQNTRKKKSAEKKKLNTHMGGGC